jgi:hypothetical protein
MPLKKEIKDDLIMSLEKDGSGANTRKWADHIITDQIPVLAISELINHERIVAMRFSWLIGTLCDSKPEVVLPSVIYFFNQRAKVKFKGFNRSLAKMFFLAGVPEEIEAEAINELFKWYLDSGSDVSTKTFCLLALYELSKKHPGLKNELKIVTEDQLDKNTVSFRKRAMKLLETL